MTAGEKIRERRLACSLTQTELAGDQMTRNMISEIESGKAMPSLKAAKYLAAKLGVSIDYLLTPARSIEEENLAVWFPKVEALFLAGKYEEAILVAHEKLAGVKSETLAYLLASAHLYAAEACAAGGSVHTAETHLTELETCMKETRFDVSHLQARAILVHALVSDPITPKYALNEDDYRTASDAATKEELYHYIRDDWEYPYRTEVYAKHMEAKRLMKEYRFQEAIGTLESAADTRYSEKISVLLLYRIYADLETCYRERKDYENAYRYAAKRNALLSSFRN